jgi:hypothetical protein
LVFIQFMFDDARNHEREDNTTNLENNIKIDVSERDCQAVVGLNWVIIGLWGGLFGHWDTRWPS